MSEYTVVVVDNLTNVDATSENKTVEVNPLSESVVQLESPTTEVIVESVTVQIDVIKNIEYTVEIIEDISSIDSSSSVLYDIPCDPTVYIGSAVRILASGTAVNALADSIANHNVIGIVENKSGFTLCDIRVSGITNEIFTGLDVTKTYYLSDTIAGAIQTTVPTISGHVKLKLGQPASDTKLFFLKGEPVIRV